MAGNKQITISLSDRSLAVIEQLKEITDADTESEVIRNALRLHLVLVRAEQSGTKFFMRNGNDSVEIVPASFLASRGD